MSSMTLSLGVAGDKKGCAGSKKGGSSPIIKEAIIMADRQALKLILKKLHEARPQDLEAVKKEAVKYFKDVDPKELALAEQELIQEGTERKEMKRLCDVHLEVMKEQLGAKDKNIKLPDSHPIKICMDEHEIIKDNLKKLKTTLDHWHATWRAINDHY